MIKYFFILIILFIGCTEKKSNKEVIIYTSVDQVYSSKIFKEFENKTGIRVLPVYDTEASKAVGLEKRLLIEKIHPKADIFWNSEPIRTVRLAKKGIFEPYKKINLPEYTNELFYDVKKRWFGLGERRRVIIVNTTLISKNLYPKRLEDLLLSKYKNKVAVSTPFVGTAATHFSAIYHLKGEKLFKKYLQEMKINNTVFLAGNSVVKDAVGRGRYAVGVVDTDDVITGIKQGLPIKMIHYNQEGRGNFSIFGTIAMIKDAPHADNAKLFIDYMLTKEVENRLIELGAVQYHILGDTNSTNLKSWTISPNKLLEDLQISHNIMKDIL